MKKLFLSLSAVIAFSIFSQAQFKAGFVAGGSLMHQRVNVSKGNALFSNDNFRGYNAGLLTEFNIGQNLYLQPQLLFSRKGATLLSSTGAADTKLRFSYIEVPVSILYKVPLGFGKVYGGAGAAFSYGIGGSQEQGNVKGKLYSHGTPWKREDISLSFTAGIEFNNGFFLSVNSRKGMLDIYKADGISIKNRSSSVSVGYLIDWRAFKTKG